MDAFKAEQNDLRDQLDRMDAVWDQRTMDSIDILLCTNDTAAHELLISTFKPRLAFIDDAESMTLPDICIPLAAFRETLEHVVMCGNREARTPGLPEQERDEFWRTTHDPFFKRLVDDSPVAEKVELKPMRGKSSRKVKGVTKKQKTVKREMQSKTNEQESGLRE